MDISETLGLISSNSIIYNALFHEDSLLLSHQSSNSANIVINSTLTINGSLLPITDRNFRSVERNADGSKLFIYFGGEIAIYDYTLEMLTLIDLHGTSNAMFKIDNRIFYTLDAAVYFEFNEASFAFESVSFPMNLGTINDIEVYAGITYAATSTGIWKIDLASNSFIQLISNNR